MAGEDATTSVEKRLDLAENDYRENQLVAQAKSVGIKGAAPKSDTRQIINGVEALMHKNTLFKESYPPE